jgi:RND family efflux transporter MFP subunit
VERAQLALAKARHEFAARKVARNNELIVGKLLSGHEADELLTELKIALLEVRSVQAALRQRSIFSPVDGLVTERNTSQGEFVGAEPLLTIAVLNPLHAELIVGAEHFGKIRPNAKVWVTTDDYVSGEHLGTVAIVDQVIHAASLTFGVRIKLANDKSRLPAGLKCRVRFAKGGN